MHYKFVAFNTTLSRSHSLAFSARRTTTGPVETHRGGRRQSFNTTRRTSGAPSTGAAIARPRLFGTTRSSPDPPAREPLSHVRRHGRHNLLQTGRFRHNLLGGRRSHPQADLQPLPLSTAFRRLSNGGIFVVSHLSNHSKTQDRDRQDDKTETPRNVGYTHRNARPRHRFLALACLAQYLQTLRARRRPWASY